MIDPLLFFALGLTIFGSACIIRAGLEKIANAIREGRE